MSRTNRSPVVAMEQTASSRTRLVRHLLLGSALLGVALLGSGCDGASSGQQEPVVKEKVIAPNESTFTVLPERIWVDPDGSESSYAWRLKRIVNNGRKSLGIKIKLTPPAEPDIVAWDAEYTMPQMMFRYDGHYWTANFNGTAMQILVHRDEVANIASKGPQVRSPDGRFLMMSTYQTSGAGDCSIFDLKTRQYTRISPRGRCGSVWSRDSKRAYIVGSGVKGYFDTEQGRFVHTHERNGDKRISGRWGGYLTPDESLFFMMYDDTFAAKRDFLDIDQGDTVFFDPDSFELVKLGEYYPKGCGAEVRYTIDHKYFACSGATLSLRDHPNAPAMLFRHQEPFEHVDMVSTAAPVLYNQFSRYFRRDNSLDRYRGVNEDTPLERQVIKFEVDGNSTARLFFWLPTNLVDSIDEIDFTDQFPSLPSHAEVAKARQLIAAEQQR
ncbi:hypothetical protein [Thaumasiovibrio sp. DFM-14]|uniref:hypothetical protein n=1 Tax=Thaumasiovibrio sp. DFM-14 TaxID=3384792 RepID=UPI00399F7077